MFSFNFYLYLLVFLFLFLLKKYNSYFPLTKHQHTSKEIKPTKLNESKQNKTEPINKKPI